ncbi:hypothetical protein [Luteimonas terrae]|uniref:Tetratricopeptide (TPR) repeat protein n=1 Tax=Luteimonas terrae TaxID=1530191 RepID=A0ABU1XTV2_9GAMM|nr:hypothetical protein [Luteimonas terrae]MDR7192202.1 tetratricopeptide (TPR) repeat protein [Luteimonas terrae]
MPEPVTPREPLASASTRARAAHADASQRRRGWWIATGVLAVVLALVVVVRLFLVDRLWPETRAQALLDDAAAATAAGRLSTSDGDGARQLYEAALALDPDDVRPRAGLADVARAAVAQAASAVEAGRFDDAHAALRLASELSAPREHVDAVASALRQREAAGAGLDRLVAEAQAAQAVGNLDADHGSALPLYRRVLALQPDNADALRGREDALAALLDDARRRLREGGLREAADLIARVREYDAGHVDLPDTEARLTEELDALRSRAARSLEAGSVERAVAEWRTLLAFDPNDARAQRGLHDAGAAYARRAERFARDFNFADAGAQLREARALAADSEAVRTAGEHVERSRARHARLGPQLPPAERRQRVDTLLQQAVAAEARGDLLTPPGDSAYDKIRAARLVAPDDPAVARASARLLPSARECFDAGLRANSLARARACLDAREVLGDAGSAVRDARRRLAQRWLAIGDERLGAGNLVGAEAALASARDIDAGVPGHMEFGRRLRAASLNR